VGFEPTNPYGTGALEGSTAKMLREAGLSIIDVKALPESVTVRDYVNPPSYMRDKDLWGGFINYVTSKYSRDHANSIVRYAWRYGKCLFDHDLTMVLQLSKGKQRHVLSAISCLAKFMGRYDEWKKLKEKYGVKIEHSRIVSFIPRFDSSSIREVSEWIVKVREALGEYKAFMDLLLATGLRRKEAEICYNLIITLSREGKLSEYYRDGWLEHFKYHDKFFRRCKNVYVSYCLPEVVTAVANSKPLGRHTLVDKLQEKKIPIRFKEVRKLWASYMTKHLTVAEIDLLQGRIGKSIFMSHYFNPNYVSDLKQRLEKAVKELFITVGVTGVTT